MSALAFRNASSEDWPLVAALLGEAGLPETAPAYFPRFGFEPTTRAEAPEAVIASVEFNGACCATAAVMRLRLG